MMDDTGASGLRPGTITRLRRSRSVTIPNEPGRGTSTALAPSSVIRLAASRIGSVPWHSSGGVLISVATRTRSSGGAAAGTVRSTIDRATNRSTSGRASSGRMTSAGMR
jgi:hypothetical protein